MVKNLNYEYELIGDSDKDKYEENNDIENNVNGESTRSSTLLAKILFACIFTFIIVLHKTQTYELVTRLNSREVNISTVQPETTTVTPIQKYYVQTKQCMIPYVDPFTSDLRKIYKPPIEENCTNDAAAALVNFDYDLNAQKYLLQINEDVQMKLFNMSYDAIVKCCYRKIVRPRSSDPKVDDTYKLLRCQDFHHNFVVPMHIDGLIVECRSNLSKKVIYQDAFSFIQYQSDNSSAKNLSAKTSREQPSSSSANISRPNVLLIGIDSLSRINFRRTMPKTFAHLNKNRWFELEGYNKIADNTYPNLMALLTGLDPKMSYDVCKPNTLNGLSKCDFVWKLYKNASYRTAYAEDEAFISTFNYQKKGFRYPPTDHYLRTFVLAIEKTLHIKKMFGLEYCVGRRRYGEYIYDNAMEFVKRYNYRQSFFGLFWTNSFSHNDYTAPASMDEKMREYLLDLERNHILDTTIVIFFSDHGARWGPLLKLAEGFFEERLPMFFIWLPKGFQNRYPEFAKALNINRHRLSSPYDIYMTLKHILALGSNDKNDNNTVKQTPIACPKCQTIFHEISLNRTCADAGIVEHWCTCRSYDVMDTKDPTFTNISKLIITEINNYLAKKNISTFCRKVTLKTVDSAEKLTQINRSDHKETHIKHKTRHNSTIDGVYRIKFTISEKLAKFQATAFYGFGSTVKLDVENEISRLNSYANDSKCINDKEAKKFCICVN